VVRGVGRHENDERDRDGTVPEASSAGSVPAFLSPSRILLR